MTTEEMKQLDPTRKGLNEILSRDRTILDYSPEPEYTIPQPVKVHQVENGEVAKRPECTLPQPVKTYQVENGDIAKRNSKVRKKHRHLGFKGLVLATLLSATAASTAILTVNWIDGRAIDKGLESIFSAFPGNISYTKKMAVLDMIFKPYGMSYNEKEGKVVYINSNREAPLRKIREAVEGYQPAIMIKRE